MTRVGISINCLNPKLSNKSGAVESRGLGLRIGFLQKQLPKFKSEAITL